MVRFDVFLASNVTPSFRNWFQDLGLEASSHGTIKTTESLRDEDVAPDLGCIDVPTGIFHVVLDSAYRLSAKFQECLYFGFDVAGYFLIFNFKSGVIPNRMTHAEADAQRVFG